MKRIIAFVASVLLLCFPAHADMYDVGHPTPSPYRAARQAADTAHAYSVPAKCDGVTDDTLTINSFMAALGKGTAVLPKGDCIVTSTLNIPNGVYLKGQGQGNETSAYGISIDTWPTRLLSKTPTFQVVTFASTAASSGISDLTIDMSKANTGVNNTTAAIGMAACYGVTVERVTFQNAGTGINMAPVSGTGCGHNVFRGLNFYNVFNAISLFGVFNTGTNACMSAATDNYFYDINIFDFWGWGIALGACADNNYFYSTYMAVTNPNTNGIILNQANPSTPNGIYSEHFYGTIMDLYNTPSVPQAPIVINATGGVGLSVGPNMFLGGAIAQNTGTPSHPIVSTTGSNILLFSTNGDSNVIECSGTPSSSFATLRGFVTHC